ncbi:autotransporter outer membrane beta-barrel domain-containing protein, partial [Helicobacter cholecystus]
MKSITLKDKVSKSSWRKIFCTTRSIGLSSLFCSVAIADETVSNLAKVLELQTKDPSSIELVSSNYSSKFVPSVSPGFYQLKDDMTKGELLDTSTIIAFDTVVIDGKNYSTFKFSDQALDTFKLYVTGESVVWDDSKKQLTIPKNSIFVSTQGLAMGENGGGTLQLDQWTSKNNTDEKTFIMDLSGVEESSYAFYGNLNFTGKTDGNKQNYSSKTAELRLGGKGIKGNVTLDTLANVNFVFNGTNPLVDGNITVSSDVTATFSNPNGVLVTQGITFNPNSNGTLIFKGNTSIAGGINFNNNAGGSVVFEGDTSITGTINKPGGQGIKGRESSLTFNGAINTIEKFNINDTVPNGQSIFKVIFTESTQSNTIHSLRAVGSRYQSDVSNTNYIIFKGGGHNLIDQSIEALPSSFEGKVGGTNDILFENKGEISGTIKASGGINHIVFNGTGIAEDSLITGVITAERSWLGPARPTLNHIEFKNGGKITSTQTILASGGTNKIEFSGNGNAIIVGDIKTTPANADDSYSYFTFNSTATNTITGNISVVPYGNGKAHNYFTFSAGDNFINGKMEAEWFNRGDTVVNSIEVKDNSRSFTFSGTAIARAGTNQVFTLSAGNNTIQNEGADVLFQDGGTTTVTFSGSGNASIIGNINTRRDGSANITFNSTGLNTIKGDIIGNKYGTNNTTATTTISSDKSLEITGNISTIYSAVTTISVDEGDLSLWGSISNNS